jgi:hypothetical protein
MHGRVALTPEQVRVREAMTDVWRQLYEVQVLVTAMDPALLDQIDVQLTQLQYRVFCAKARVKSSDSRY